MSAKRPPDRLQQIGGWLKAARGALGLSQVAICRAIGVQQNTWSMWEKGERLLDPLAAIRFADRYDISLDWLYRGKLSALPGYLADRLIPVQNEPPPKPRPGSKPKKPRT